MNASGNKSRKPAGANSDDAAPAKGSCHDQANDRKTCVADGNHEVNTTQEAWNDPAKSTEHCEAIASSSCGDSKGRQPETVRPLRLQCSDCADIVHQLANIMTAVLMNAHVLEWKLPPYSHLKRSVREVERNAQRGGELLKQFMRRVAPGEVEVNLIGASSRRAGTAARAANEAKRKGIEGVGLDLTSDGDPCTSSFFPKRDDSREG
jgi:hypothetical protein